MRRLVVLAALAVLGLLLACNGGGESLQTATPQSSPSGTPTATSALEPTPAAATEALPSPVQPVPLEEGAPITETGVYVVHVESGRVWKVAEFATVQWSPDGGGLMIWGSSIVGGTDVVDIAEGSAVRILSEDPTAAAWSPDGTQIAFSRHGPGPQGPKGLYVINRDGSGLKLLSERGAYAVEWSAGGDHIAFSVWLDHIYVLEVARGRTIDLADAGGYALAWSPNGTELAFTNDSGLYIYDAETGDRRQVGVGPSDGPILWSPDGSRIAFRFGPRVPLTHGPDAGKPGAGLRIFHVAEVDGSGEPKPLPPARSVSWSSDGTRIVYLSEGCITDNWDLYTVDPNGGSSVRLTNTPETFKEGPFWSPTSSTIAFGTDDELILVDTESGEFRTLASGGPQSGGPGIHLHDAPWSPDGRYIQFSAGGGHGVCD